MNEKREKPPPQGTAQGRRERLAESIYSAWIVQGRHTQFTTSKIAQDAREASEAFYPDEPTPNVEMRK